MKSLPLIVFLLCPAAAADDFTVDGYTKLVLEKSPDVKEARQSYEQTAAQYKSQLAAAALPTVSFSGLANPYGYNTLNGYRFNHWRLKRGDMSFNTSVNWNLFNSFQDFQKVRQAGLSRASAERSLLVVQQSRALSAIRAYYDLNSTGQLLEVARQNLKAQEEQYRQTLDLYRHGMKSLSDLLKSETDWRSSEERMAQATADQKGALVSFNAVIDRPPLAPAALKMDLEPGATTLPLVDSDLAKAVSRRPEVLRAKKDLEASAVAVQQALQAAFPNLAVNATVNRQDLGPASSVPNPNYQVGLNLSLPFNFNIVSQVFNYYSAAAAQRRAQGALDAVLLQARQDLYNAFVQLERATLTHGIVSQKEAIAKRNLDLVVDQYRQGAADVIRLSQAQLDYLNAQVSRAQALHDIFINRALYKLAVGEQLW